MDKPKNNPTSKVQETVAEECVTEIKTKTLTAQSSLFLCTFHTLWPATVNGSSPLATDRVFVKVQKLTETIETVRSVVRNAIKFGKPYDIVLYVVT